MCSVVNMPACAMKAQNVHCGYRPGRTRNTLRNWPTAAIRFPSQRFPLHVVHGAQIVQHVLWHNRRLSAPSTPGQAVVPLRLGRMTMASVGGDQLVAPAVGPSLRQGGLGLRRKKHGRIFLVGIKMGRVNRQVSIFLLSVVVTSVLPPDHGQLVQQMAVFKGSCLYSPKQDQWKRLGGHGQET